MLKLLVTALVLTRRQINAATPSLIFTTAPRFSLATPRRVLIFALAFFFTLGAGCSGTRQKGNQKEGASLNAAAKQDSPEGQNWIRLFNGKDIKDWTVKINHHDAGDNFGNTFRVEDGMIKVRYDQYGAFNEQFGHLYFNRPFSHFHLKFEYRITGKWKEDAPGYTIRNSGVMFHSQDPRSMLRDQDWPISVEFQLLASLDNGKPRPTGNMCSPGTDVVYQGKIDERHCIESSSKTYPVDEWVQGELIVLGDSLVTHIINGDTVLRYSKPQVGGGKVNNYDTAVKIDQTPLKEGFIALQSEGQPIDFRNIELLEL